MSADLLRCLRWDAEGDSRLRRLTPGDWERLWTLIVEGNGHHLLARRLQRARLDAPAPVLAGLRARAMAIAARNLEGRGLLARAIVETGRPALLLKGVDLAERLYGNLGHRPMGDVDLLVHAEDAMAYHAHFIRHGFVTSAPPSAEMLALVERHHLIYVRGAGQGVPFELHWRLSEARNDGPVDRAAIWRRALAHPLAPGARVMGHEDLFLYLCLHLKHHGFETSLTQLWDLAELLRAPAFAIDWPLLWHRAAEWRVAEAVRVALFLVEDTLGVPADMLAGWRPGADLAARLPDLLPALGGYPPSAHAQGRLAAALSPHAGWAERWRALRRGLVPTRFEVRSGYGRPGDGAWGDIRAYLRRYRQLIGTKGAIVRAWASGKGGVRGQIDRLEALRRHLDERG